LRTTADEGSCDAPSPSSQAGLYSICLTAIAESSGAPSPSNRAGQAPARETTDSPGAASRRAPFLWHERGSAPCRRNGQQAPRTRPSRFRTSQRAEPCSPTRPAAADEVDAAPSLDQDGVAGPNDRVP